LERSNAWSVQRKLLLNISQINDHNLTMYYGNTNYTYWRKASNKTAHWLCVQYYYLFTDFKFMLIWM
jgi:hypothetical protein